MSDQCIPLATTDHRSGADFAAVATRLVEAACFARDGDCEAAKALVSRAMALLRREPGAIPANVNPLGGVREVTRVTLAAWQKRRLITFIDANLADRIRLSDLAGLLKLSTSHFSRVFRHAFGTSANDYVGRRRIEEAQALMLTTSEPLAAIALRCGLSDQSHFTRVFRRIVGETPFAWRRTRCGEFEDRHTERLRQASDLPRVADVSSRVASGY